MINKQIAQLMIDLAVSAQEIVALQIQLDEQVQLDTERNQKLVEVAKRARVVQSAHEMGIIKGGAFWYDLKGALDTLESGDQY